MIGMKGGMVLNNRQYAVNVNVVILGSISNIVEIHEMADIVKRSVYTNVWNPEPQPNVELKTLIRECFDQIRMADIVYAVSKKNGSIGDGVSYELEYARSLGKICRVYSTKENAFYDYL